MLVSSNGMKKAVKIIVFGLIILLGSGMLFLFAGKVQPAEDVVWGVGFSKNHAEALGLDWKAVYTNLLDDMQVKNIKLSVDWSDIEAVKDEFIFKDVDWQLQEAEKRNANILLVIGMKTLRWPECHIPKWANGLSKEQQQKEVLQLLERIVTRYKNSPTITRWQVENEPFFVFGDCPWERQQVFKKGNCSVRVLG